MSKRKEILTILVGIVAALIILISQVGFYQVQHELSTSVSVEKSIDDDTAEESPTPQLKIFNNDAIATVVHVVSGQDFHIITTLYPKFENIITVWVEQISEGVTAYFRTLFQRIISPNAP
ncbi:MAG: hypothetical protein OEX02_03520 [Cyclobacteriaceae bacterium]|nr:hypothetical protein [Cyclobacteriaceae bacterium]